MFAHIFTYRLRVLLRDRILIFWTLLYPIALGTFFGIAFHNIGNGSPFHSIPVAVVENAVWQSDETFRTALQDASVDDAGKKLFAVTAMSQEQANQSLKDGDVVGYLVLEEGEAGAAGNIRVVVHSSGVSQSILRQFVDSYLQTSAAYTTILTENPDAMQSLSAVPEEAAIEDATPGGMASNSTIPYFYALIAMAALFGGFWGQREVNDAQADQSDLGQRLGVAPIHKLKALVAGMCAAILLQFASLLVLIAYLALVLGVQFTAPLPMLLASLLGSAMGVTFGAFLSALPIRKEGIKIAVLITVSLALSFLAGLMVSTVKYSVIHAVPAMAYLNPANVLSDAFYALYAYTDYSRFLLNVGLLGVFSVAFSLIIYLFTRRQKYDSL